MVTTKGETKQEYGTTKGMTAPDSIQDNNQPWTCNNSYQQQRTKELLRFLHTVAFSSTISMWAKAVNNNQFTAWPRFTVLEIRKYLQDSITTAKGYFFLWTKIYNQQQRNQLISLLTHFHHNNRPEQMWRTWHSSNKIWTTIQYILTWPAGF